MGSSKRITSGTMFASAAIFGALLLLVSLGAAYAARETKRILETGRKTTATVLSKERPSGRGSPSVEIRIDELPAVEPFRRTLFGEEFRRTNPGDKLPYVYDPADPQGGVLGTPQSAESKACFFAAASSFAVIFLLAGMGLKLRERGVSAASGS
jgi:hypothetical protein